MPALSNSELKELIEAAVSKSVTPITLAIKSIESKVDGNAAGIASINKFINGNGEPERGATIRLDRLEQRDKARAFWINTAIGAAITAIVIAAIDWFQKH